MTIKDKVPDGLRHAADAPSPFPLNTPLNRLIWDFFGRSAEDVARHFLTHLKDFLSQNDLSSRCRPLIQSENAWHWSVYCDFEQTADAKAVAKVLKPSGRSQIDSKTLGDVGHSTSSELTM